MSPDGFVPWPDVQWMPDRTSFRGRSKCKGTLTLRDGDRAIRVRWFRRSRDPGQVVVRSPRCFMTEISAGMLPEECRQSPRAVAQATYKLGRFKVCLLGDMEGVVIKLHSPDDQEVYTLVGVPWNSSERVRPRLGIKVKQQHALAKRNRREHSRPSCARWVPS